VSSNGEVQQGAEQLLVNILSWNGQAISRINDDHGIQFQWQREYEEGSTAAALLSIAVVVQHMLPRWAATRTATGSSSSSSGSHRHAAAARSAGADVQPAQQRHQQCLPLLVLVAQLQH
jgi:hypothetical protein